MTLPEQDRYLLRESYIQDELVKMLGGRMAEELVFGETSSGAADDLARATEMAGKMVREWGMSDRVGPMAWRASSGQVFLGDEMGRGREYSDEMAHVIDEEIELILRNAESRCRDLLTEHRHGLDLVARNLLEVETIDGAEVGRLLEIGVATTMAAETGGGETAAETGGGETAPETGGGETARETGGGETAAETGGGETAADTTETGSSADQTAGGVPTAESAGAQAYIQPTPQTD